MFAKNETDLETALFGQAYVPLDSSLDRGRYWCDQANGEVSKIYRMQLETPTTAMWWLELIQTEHYFMHPEHGEVHLLEMRLRHQTMAKYDSFAEFEAWYHHDRALIERPAMLAFLRHIATMDLTYDDGTGDLFHLPGWYRPSLLPQVSARIEEAGFVQVAKTPYNHAFQYRTTRGNEALTSDSLLIVPSFPCYQRERVSSWRCTSVERARMGLDMERRFLDAWELLERSAFHTDYLDTFTRFSWET